MSKQFGHCLGLAYQSQHQLIEVITTCQSAVAHVQCGTTFFDAGQGVQVALARDPCDQHRTERLIQGTCAGLGTACATRDEANPTLFEGKKIDDKTSVAKRGVVQYIGCLQNRVARARANAATHTRARAATTNHGFS